MIRATVSAPPPGGNPMIQRSGRDGYACALAIRDRAGRAAAPAARCRNCRRGSFMASAISRDRTFGMSRWELSNKIHRLPVGAEGGAMSVLGTLWRGHVPDDQ